MKFINTKINMNKACLNVEISMIEKCVENPERLYGIWRESKEENAKQPSKIIKPEKVTASSKDMSLEVFQKTYQGLGLYHCGCS